MKRVDGYYLVMCALGGFLAGQVLSVHLAYGVGVMCLLVAAVAIKTLASITSFSEGMDAGREIWGAWANRD